MKKLFYGVSVFMISILLLTGCGDSERTLTCTKSTEDSGTFAEEKYDYIFKGTKVTSYIVTQTFGITEDTASIIGEDGMKEAFEVFRKEWNDVDTTDGTTLDFTEGETTITVTIKTDPTKMSDKNKEFFGFEGKSFSYDMTKQEWEKNEYTCK